ncbi:MAG: hypothetical protein F6K17_30925, partial [Okeania sp. SIO3C4]|nr:hypothetical protein [Okeania sp. SIO3C4]
SSSVRLWSDRKTKKRFGLGGRCYVSAAPLFGQHSAGKEAAESPEPRGLGMARCRAMANVGRMSTLTKIITIDHHTMHHHQIKEAKADG